MSIQKEKILPNGVVASDWRVIREDYDRLNGTFTCFMDLFIDPNKTMSIGALKMFTFNVTEQDMAGDRTALAYILIKATNDPDLVDGVDT